MLIVKPAHCTTSTVKRAALCGTPLRLRRESGQTTDTRFCCGSTWCDYCSKLKRHRVRECLLARINSSPTMVTLTFPPVNTGLTESALREQLEAKRELWRRTSDRLRWLRHHERRADLPAAAATAPPPGRGGPHPWFASTWQGDRWAHRAEPWSCTWATEVTAGDPDRGGKRRRRHSHGHWHVHIHVLVPSREWAEVLNACWQASAAELGHVPDGDWTKTHFAEMSGDGAAAYLAKALAAYTAKGSDLSKIPRSHHGAYVRATHNLRRWDAQGGWRPLGIGDRPEPEDPATHVLPFGALHDDDPERELDVPIAEWYSGRAPAFAAYGAVLDGKPVRATIAQAAALTRLLARLDRGGGDAEQHAA